jgi:uroporphyrinogen decarboxylase
MTPKERLLACLAGKIPDCVPVAPDISNMVPARLTGKPFWDLYLYNDPPIWEAYIAAAKYFGFDSVMDGYFPLRFPEDTPKNEPDWETFIVFKNEERIVTQKSYKQGRKRVWNDLVNVYYIADSPTGGVKPKKIGLPPKPKRFEPLEGVKPIDTSPLSIKHVKDLMGDQGLVGVWLASTCALSSQESIFQYYDHPELHEQWAQERVEKVERRFKQIQTLPVRPDFLCVGGSGTLIWQTPKIFKQLAFPAVKRAIELASEADYMTHIHSCGPETALVKIMAEETRLTVIDPLESPPMGDCDLADLKKKFGRKLTLKGNLHTTEVMLKGSVADVIRESKKCIDAAAEGGRFILSTGDQCGRDTPLENLKAMIDTARNYGKY